MSLTNKIDFAVVFSVKNANPNGDPLNGNRPRTTMDGRGEISDVCLKRKIRNRLMDLGENVFVQSDDKNLDSYRSLKDRADACAAFKNEKDKEKAAAAACKEWFDVISSLRWYLSTLPLLPLPAGAHCAVSLRSVPGVYPCRSC